MKGLRLSFCMTYHKIKIGCFSEAKVTSNILFHPTAENQKILEAQKRITYLNDYPNSFQAEKEEVLHWEFKLRDKYLKSGLLQYLYMHLSICSSVHAVVYKYSLIEDRAETELNWNNAGQSNQLFHWPTLTANMSLMSTPASAYSDWRFSGSVTRAARTNRLILFRLLSLMLLTANQPIMWW